MKTIRQILDGKSSDLSRVGPETSVREALERMAQANVGSVLVLDGGRLIGIFTERDFARKAVGHARALDETPVREMMTDPVYYVTPAQSVGECMALMTEKRVRHLPVLEDGTLLGVVSIGDVVKATISEQRFIIEQLERYITG
jgi:CBS domain-containing protein